MKVLQILHTISLTYCLISQEHMTKRLRDVQFCVAPIVRTGHGEVCSLAAHGNDTTDSQAGSPAAERNQMNTAWGVILYNIQHTFLILHTASSMANACSMSVTCFSQITICSFRYTSIRFVFNLVIHADIPSMQWELPSQKPYTKCISVNSASVNLGIFSFHSSYYLYYCQNLIIVLHLLHNLST